MTSINDDMLEHESEYLKMKDLCRLSGYSKASLSAMQKLGNSQFDPTFPPKIHWGPKSVRYSRAEFSLWLKNRPARMKAASINGVSAQARLSTPASAGRKGRKPSSGRNNPSPKPDIAQDQSVEAVAIPAPSQPDSPLQKQEINESPMQANAFWGIEAAWADLDAPLFQDKKAGSEREAAQLRDREYYRDVWFRAPVDQASKRK